MDSIDSLSAPGTFYPHWFADKYFKTLNKMRTVKSYILVSCIISGNASYYML